jgi:hypothetical protein
LDSDDPINLELVCINEEQKQRRMRRRLGLSWGDKLSVEKYRTIYYFRVRPPVFTLEKRGDRVIDERGFEYKSFDVYLSTDKRIDLPPSALIRLRVRPFPSPRTQQTVLLATDVSFPDEEVKYDVEKLKHLRAKFNTFDSVDDRVKWILDEFEIYSHIVGRQNLAFAGFLCYFTPLYFEFDGDVQRGWGLVIFIGDTTTAKSETLKKLIALLGRGTLITAETASLVGLTGTSTQLLKEGWFVDWGLLVLSDRRLLGIDGFHKLPSASSASLAEAERSGVIMITKAGKNSAYARTRQVKIGNPVDLEEERFKTKKIDSFLYRCMALPSFLDMTSIARLDLAAFTGEFDVKAEEVNKHFSRQYDQDLLLLAEALKWCWSGKVKLAFTTEAVEEILRSATELYNTFHSSSVPLVSMDMKFKLARLSAALAYLLLSTEDFETVTIKKEHVQYVRKFIESEYSKAGLNIIAQTERHETLTLEDVNLLIDETVRELGWDRADRDRVKDIWRFIVLNGRVTKDGLKTKFSLADKGELRPLIAVMQNQGLIRTGKGFYPKQTLIEAYKIIERGTLNKSEER